MLGQTAVGLFQASISISMVSLGFVMTALGQDYYPRVAANASDDGTLRTLINEQHHIVMLVAIPAILAIKAVAPWIVPLLFSAGFVPAVEILEWQLVADLLKFSSWTLSFVILARSGGTTYFLAELSAGVTTLVATAGLVSLLGFSGLGFSFCVTYAVYWVVTSTILRRQIGFRFTGGNLGWLGIGLAAAALPSALPWLGLPEGKPIAAITLAVLATAIAGRRLWKILSSD